VKARRQRRSLSPLGAVVRGAFAGAVGTAAMDLVWYVRYTRDGGEQSFLAWEFGESITKWDDVSAPGQVGRRVLEGFLQQELPDRWARATNNVVHWLYGSMWGAQYGVVAGSVDREAKPSWGLALAPVVWLSGYVVLPLAKLYKPLWEYDAETLMKDFTAHLAYGAATGAAFARLTEPD